MEAAWARYFAFGTLEFPDDMAMAMVAREMGWTWRELNEQPVWFVRNLLAYMAAESEHIRKQQKK